MSSLTVIIVAHNHGPYIRQAIESVLHQTYHVNKTIIINNGSSDLTELIAKEYLNLYFPYIEYHSFIHNRGQLAAFNKGLELSKTEYTCFLDADDELDHTYIAKMLTLGMKNPHPAIIYSNFLLFGPREKLAWLTYPTEWRRKEGSSFTVHVPSYSEQVKYLLKKQNYINNAALFNTQHARAVGGFIEHEKYDIRHFLWYRLFDVGHTAIHCPHVLFRYRQHSILQASWQWRVRKIDAPTPADQQILFLQEEIEHMKDSAFYKTEQVLARLADNFKCDCEK